MFSFVSQEILYNIGVLEGYRTLYMVSLATGSHIVLLLIYFGFRLFTVAPYLFRGESLQGLFHPSAMSFLPLHGSSIYANPCLYAALITIWW